MMLGEIVDGYLIHLRHHLGQLLPEVEEQAYSDEQIAQWGAEDTLAEPGRARILDRLTNPT